MASSLRVNAIVPASGTNVAIGTAGGTITYTASVSGVSTFSNGIIVSAGTTAIPSISPTGDSNTGIFFPSADTVCIGEGGVEVIRVDSSGRVGVGTNLMTRPFEVWAGTAGTSFSVDTAGRVQMPFQPVFYAYQTASLFGSALGVFTTQFNATLVNTGSCYSTSTGRFTAPIAGTYRFEAKMLARHSSSTGALEFTFYKNGSNVVGRSFCYTSVSATGDHDNMYASAYLTLSQNDYIQVGFTVVNAGTDYYYGENLASFSGQLIG